MPYKPNTNKIDKAKIPENRPSSSKRGYDSSWRMVRLQHLLNHPLCMDCLKEKKLTPANEVHHIKKLADNPTLRDEPPNLLSLCKSCHSVRTNKGE